MLWLQGSGANSPALALRIIGYGFCGIFLDKLLINNMVWRLLNVYGSWTVVMYLV